MQVTWEKKAREACRVAEELLERIVKVYVTIPHLIGEVEGRLND